MFSDVDLSRDRLLDMMLSACSVVFSVNIETDRGHIVKIDRDIVFDSVRALADEAKAFSGLYAQWVEMEVHPDYRDAMAEFAKAGVIRDTLDVSPSYSIKFTRMIGGRMIDVVMFVMRMEPLGEKLRHVVFAFIDMETGLREHVPVEGPAFALNRRRLAVANNILRILWSEIGRPVSYRTIAERLRREKVDISASSVLNYLREFIRSGLVFKVNGYDVFAECESKQECAYYFVNVSDASRLYGKGVKDTKRILRNSEILNMRHAFAKVYSSIHACDGDIVTFGQNGDLHVWIFDENGKLVQKD